MLTKDSRRFGYNSTVVGLKTATAHDIPIGSVDVVVRKTTILANRVTSNLVSVIVFVRGFFYQTEEVPSNELKHNQG